MEMQAFLNEALNSRRFIDSPSPDLLYWCSNQYVVVVENFF